ncbi:metalloregulator ArsR/SmtB family transcription factor [Subtercola sp. PAMC28395]|uniref:ArsR/SmtB family transcription factor n=1 Tax=Subtercola sp. PAMC28395 TaxID=2846775 RepID=UPI001C0BF96D|nr:metalloregulator ArsR/SmtB family transcription factor [Subtercola sp. PAMC28395]QWT22657.1 metalloregulator ArsR/SmtB family transcription factor [Subtercola sp. PAMC28395]
MVVEIELTDEEVNRIFRALADATRRDIVRRTLVAEVSVSQLAESYDMSFAAVQKHVAVLEEASLVTKEARGRERMVRGVPDRIRQAQRLLDQLEQLWRSRIDRLDALLGEPRQNENAEHEHPEHEHLEHEHPELERKKPNENEKG